MKITVHQDKVFWLLDVLLARWKSKPKQYPYNRQDAIIPQTIVPPQLRQNRFQLACFYFYVCIYMRGGIESLQAFFALLRMWYDHPMLFIPSFAATLEPEWVEVILRKYIGWDAKQAAKHWVENSRRLVRHWGGNPLNLLKGLTTYDEALRRLQNKHTAREKREAGPDGLGFMGFQPKMVSMFVYFMDWEGMLEVRFLYPSPADFHNFRMGFGIVAIEIEFTLEEETRQDIEMEQNEFPELGMQPGEHYVRATEKLSKPWRDAVMAYLVERKADPLEVSDAIWLYSLVMCGNSPATVTKPLPTKEEKPDKFWSNGQRKPKQLSLMHSPHIEEVWDHGAWVATKKSRGLEQTCFVCAFAEVCKVAVPSKPYYRKGKLIMNRPHPMLSMDVPFGSFKEPNPSEILLSEEYQHLLELEHDPEKIAA